MFEVYKPSGGFGVSTMIYLLCSLIAAGLLAFAYAYGLRHIPFIYVSFLMTGAFGLALGFLGSLTVRTGHCRNAALAGLIGIMLCVFGVAAKHYVQYGLWVSDVTDGQVEFETREGTIKPTQADEARKEIRDLVVDKYSYLDHFKERADEGITIGRRGNGAPLTGIFMYSIWLIELGMVLWLALMMPVNSAREPYSETMGMWADETEEAMRLPISSEEMVAQIQSANTVEELLEIPIPKTIDYQRYALYSVHSVPGEEMEDAYLSVSLFVRSIDKDGDEKLDETELVQNAILTSEQRAQLLENASLMNEALDAYRQAMIEDAAGDEENDDA